MVEEPPLTPPAVLCFSQNAEETLAFLADVREASGLRGPAEALAAKAWFARSRRHGGRRVVTSYVDYSEIEQVSTAAALVIAADYDRLRRLMGDKVPPTINLHRWSEAVFTRFYELGFFDIVGLTSDLTGMYQDDGVTRTMRIVSGSNSGALEHAAEGLLSLGEDVTAGRELPDDLILALNTALSEAMNNVAEHAYPDGHAFEFRHVGKLWVTAAVDRLEGSLTVVIYDQGATIPVTYPVKATGARVRAFLEGVLRMRGLGRYDVDGAYIEAAMCYGSTMTAEPFRGKGIHDMRAAIDMCGRGRLTIFSRGGRCEYDATGSISRESFPHSIGGTLVEWVVQLPRAGHA